MTRYNTGADFEREVRKHLAYNGYEIMRSAGSKGKVDLVAFKPGQVLFVQCKHTEDGYLLPLERRELLRISQMTTGGVALVAWLEHKPRHIVYRRLRGYGAGDSQPWAPDFLDEVR